MVGNPIIKKSLAVGIILVFIGVAIAPSINVTVVKAANDNDLVEVTSQACGIKGYGNTTVKLTRQQADEVDVLFEMITSKLNNTTSREESVRIYHDAVVELDKYGLLPQGMSIEKASRFISKWNQNRYERVLNNRRPETFPNFTNVFCLLAGSAIANSDNYAISLVIPVGPLFVSTYALVWLLNQVGKGDLAALLSLIIFPIAFLNFFNPLKFMNVVFIFDCIPNLHSLGLKGAVHIQSIQSNHVLLVVGYTGLMFWSLEKSYFLGSALGVV